MNFDENFKNEIEKTSSKNMEADEVTKTYNNDIIANKIDFSKYIFNNWLIKESNHTLVEINKKGGAIWLNCNGDLCYRFNENTTVTIQPHTKANIVFTNYLGKDIKLIKGSQESPANVKSQDLIMVSKDVFNPFKLEEFYQEDYLYFRNIFKPTKYLQIKIDKYKEPKTILKLMKHLVNENEEYYIYFINWLAYFSKD